MKKFLMYIPILFLTLSMFSTSNIYSILVENKSKITNYSITAPNKSLPKWWR
ncbi:hypothetical protein [Clostridium celatum]|uniref:Uncharacterized protein n=1 Tax=Clostridium celatum DSM 1785 TaxID=545697 RepID=L1Q2E2_9CLOT|nr:hypothetical protein [Clostridium celatum]EKY22076.1 hypothetical protein HMPREF0216_03406 [Clostridium celatum DSM 1785]MCE9654507.1 hypothetical protein [Clostridium celatum]MDU3724563.1 hypothetical protein [Clostridium celatum]MDU6296403.1 hypothetical protein [Clostridium celatum]MDY3359887.1 hypothetical protein [Clostridium celatum]